MPHILCEVSTRGRYDLTLAACLQSIISQSRKPDKFLLIDDNPPESRMDLRKHPVIAPLLAVLCRTCGKGAVQAGPNKGPHANHELARREAEDLVWRVDDDECPNPDVLERLEKFFTGKSGKKAGAACGCVHGTRTCGNPYADSSLPGFRGRKNVQWFEWPEGTVMDNLAHIHSTYLYRAKAGGFQTDLSPVGHTEETWHTVNMKMMGYDLYFDAGAVTRHYQQKRGGIRMNSRQEMWASDEKRFNEWLDSLPVDWVMPVDFFATQGLGDACALRKALPEILDGYGDDKLLERRLFAKPEFMPIFEDVRDRLDIVLPADKAQLFHSFDHWNIYHYMSGKKWRGGLSGAYVDYYREKGRGNGR